MPKNQTSFTLKGNLDISDITKGIEQLRAKIQSSDLGTGLTAGLTKDLNAIQKKFETAFKNLPGVGATSKQVDTFATKIYDAAEDLNLLAQKMKDFGATDKYIKENIGSIQKFANALSDASRKAQEAKAALKENFQFQDTDPDAKIKTIHKEHTGKMRTAANAGDIVTLRKEYDELTSKIQSRITESQEKGDTTREQALLKVLEQLRVEWTQLLPLAEQVKASFDAQTKAQEDYTKAFQKSADNIDTNKTGIVDDLNDIRDASEKVGDEAVETAQDLKKIEEANSVLDNVQRRMKDLFSTATIFSTIRRIVRGAIQDFQELDKQFNEIAIVSDYSTKEMWESFSDVNKVAQEFGVQTKNVLEVQNLYYHQGKDMAEVNKLTAQTLTLAKITGMDYERATSDLTAALNAYNIAAEDAVRVTDTIAAMDTNAAISSEELMTALTKTASIAANAGMSLESTEVFLTKMIETTREAPENLGTALKTIIARFGEVKQEIDGQEVELADINRVDTALKSIGISLLDTAGQIRDLDGVFMELSSKWDDLDRNTQRYIATIAAGSRQQSRFIAMMEDYDRTLELTEIAQNSAGLGAKQLAKSQESIESSLNRLKSSWQEFYSGFITSGMIKGVLDLANGFLGLLNELNKVSPALSLVVIGLTGWLIKTKLIDGAIGNFSKKLVENVAAVAGQKIAVDGSAKSNGILMAILSALGITIEGVTDQINEDTKQRIAHTGAIEAENLALKKQNAIPKSNKKIMGKLSDYGEAFRAGEKKGESIKKAFGEGGLKSGIKSLIPQKATSVISGIITKIVSAGSKVMGILSGLGISIGALTGVIAGLAAVITLSVVAYKKFAMSLDDTKSIEKLQKAQESYNNTLKEYNDLKEKSKVIEQYRGKQNLSTEQLQEEQEAAKALVSEYPELLNYIDEEGRYWLKDAEAIQKVIDAKEELLDQEATNYTELRLKYAKEGIYSDTSTQAGKTMQDIQSYAATLDEEQLKEMTKEIDAAWQGISFNGSQYKKMMQAFAEGKKYSFDEKDMSSLFAGDIGEKNWNKFLKAVNENPIVLESEETLAKALQETDAYSENNAKEVAQAFIKMNNENGKLFSRLIEGAAQEYSQIEIQQAKIEIAKGDFATDLSSEVTDALAREALENAKTLHPNWDNLSEETRTSYIEEETEKLVSAFEDLTKQQIEGINTVFTSGNAGALKISDIRNFKVEANAEADQRAELQKFWDVLPEEIQKQFPREKIQTLSAQVVEVLFNLIKEAIGDAGVKELVDGLVKNFNDSKDMYATGDFKFDSSLLEGLTLDQIKALTNKTNSMSTEQIAPYLSTVMAEYKKALDTLDAEQATEVINVLAKADLTTQDGIENTAKNLRGLGYTVKEVWDIAIAAANGIDNISLDNFTSTTERTKKEVEQLATDLEGATALIEGSASLDQLERYMSQMMDYWTETQGIEQATVLMQQLNDSVVATGDGFKIGATAGGDYAKSLVEMTKSMIVYRIATQELEMETKEAAGELSDQEKANYLMTIAYLKKTYAYVDAQSKKAINDGLVKDLEKAKEKADELVESLKALVDWLMKFDRFSNLGNISKGLENDFEHLEYEIEFSTNADVIKQDIEDQLSNINTQIAVNQGGLRAAEDEKAMRRDVIEKNYSDYVSFDVNGRAIVDAQKMQELQEKIAKTDKERQPALQAEADLIMDSVDAYNNAEEAVNEYSSALEDNFSDLEKVLKDNYQAIIDMEEKLIEVRQEAEDKELEAVKDKYDAIKEENDKYLDSVREMIDEERRIRDRANQEQDVKDKEKKLAMMKMDTSGVYARDIRALEKELEGDYRNLEDDAVDNAIDELEKTFNTQAELYDKEIEYMENSLEYKREMMTEYNQWAQEMMTSGSDNMLAYLKANDQEYVAASKAEQQLWEMEWKGTLARGEAAHQAMSEDLMISVSNSLDSCKDSANGFEGAIQEYGKTAMATNGEIEGSIETLTSYYEGLATGVSGVTDNVNLLRDAYAKAAKAAEDLKKVQDEVIIGEGPPDTDIDDVKNKLNGNNGKVIKTKHKATVNDYKNVGLGFIGDWDENLNVDPNKTKTISENGQQYQTVYVKDLKGYVRTDELLMDDETRKITYQDYSSKNPDGVTMYDWKIHKDAKVYATGGYVDYTGPAWVDGTKSHPEYMLNATQTQQFETLVAALSSMFTNGNTPISQTSQKIGDAVYNFHIKVDQMASDYDVDQLISRIEEKMVKASQYRNVTLVKKQK